MRLINSVGLSLLLAVGCSSAPQAGYVTRAELREMLNLSPTPLGRERDGNMPLNQAQIDELVRTSMSSPDADARTASALVSADERARPLAKTLESIDAAIKLCAQNLANAETTGYKRRTAIYTSAGHADIRTDWEQGSLESTNRPLDVSISGNGVFQIKPPGDADGNVYSRNGGFFVNQEGQIVLGVGIGYQLVPPITVPSGVTDINISETGEIDVRLPGNPNKMNIGQIELAQFINFDGLEFVGGTLYKATESSGPPTVAKPGDNGSGKTLQGFLEASNVDPLKESLRIKVLQEWRSNIVRAVDALSQGQPATSIGN